MITDHRVTITNDYIILTTVAIYDVLLEVPGQLRI